MAIGTPASVTNELGSKPSGTVHVTGPRTASQFGSRANDRVSTWPRFASRGIVKSLAPGAGSAEYDVRFGDQSQLGRLG